ncbi:MAG: amidohydrolase family protein [Rhizobiaceae bacterium]|nr:amidohydrolase family protein [Rhizobiaceae bacterium]
MSSTEILAVDCHLHAHWPRRFPYAHKNTSFIEMDNEAASAESLFPTLEAHGVSHTIIVQPGAYGTDNRAMLEAIAISNGRAKGVACVPLNVSGDELEDLKRGGIVGIRVSLVTWDSEAFDRPEIANFLSRCREHDLYVEVFAPTARWPAILTKLIASGVHVIVEHVGWPTVTEGTGTPGFQALLEYGRSTNAIIKISGGFRLTQSGGNYDDVKPFVTDVVEAFGPDRCVWGSDWPLLDSHLGPLERPFLWKLDYSTEFNSLAHWVPDESVRRTILWDTPARVFGFQR